MTTGEAGLLGLPNLATHRRGGPAGPAKLGSSCRKHLKGALVRARVPLRVQAPRGQSVLRRITHQEHR